MDGLADSCVPAYQAAVDFLYGRINYERSTHGVPAGKELNLDRMRRLLDCLGNPQESLRTIHIAGTKGKGSTATMIAEVLQEAGYRTGLYTSPHLMRLEERIRIGGIECSADELIELVDWVRPAVAALDQSPPMAGLSSRPTFFEITTAMAMVQFARQRVDAAVVEVGLGGRLDSTNVCRPSITVITTISFDHTQQLGNTLAAIAGEKAGIIKPGIPLICGVTQPEPKEVIKRRAGELEAPFQFLDADFAFQYRSPSSSDASGLGGMLDFHDLTPGENSCLESVSLRMLGEHQAANAALAIATLRRLRSLGWNILDEAIRRGLAAACCAARVEVVSRQPTVVLDTAHNVASIEALLTALDASFTSRRRTLIFAATRDKDVTGMLQRLLPRFDAVILTRYLDNPRAVEPSKLVSLSEKILSQLQQPLPHLTSCESPEEAWKLYHASAHEEDLVCVTGSFFLAAEMRPWLSQFPVVARHAPNA